MKTKEEIHNKVKLTREIPDVIILLCLGVNIIIFKLAMVVTRPVGLFLDCVGGVLMLCIFVYVRFCRK